MRYKNVQYFQVTFVARPEDNGSQLRCEAINEAVTKPVYNTITIELLPESTTKTPMTSTTPSLDYPVYSEENDNDLTESDNEDYYDYNDEDYMYEYPDSKSIPTDDPAFMHPELTNKALFMGKIPSDIPQRVDEKLDHFVHKTDKNPLQIDEAKWKKSAKVHENEVYPKDAPYRSHNSCNRLHAELFLAMMAFILPRHFLW